MTQLLVERMHNDPAETGFYVAIDSVESDGENGTYFRFDGVEISWVENNLNNNSVMQEIFSEMRPFLFEFHDTQNSLRNKIAGVVNGPQEGQWLKIYVTASPSGDLIYRYAYDSSENSETLRYLAHAEVVEDDDETLNVLKSKFSLDDIPEATEDVILGFLDTARLDERSFVAVYEVGQGNLNAICNLRNTPMLYFDLGGGALRNYHTYAVPLRMCFSGAQPVILSHWDMDHIETARRDIVLNGATSIFLKSAWLVPNQNLSPAYRKFAATLHAAGKLYKWPNGLPRLNFTFGTIIKCTGPGKNHSGLALELDLRDPGGSDKKILLPADAAYTHIPGAAGTAYDGLVATHHGAEFPVGNGPVPSANPNGIICYSFGTANSYLHPRKPSIDAHNAGGWILRLDTTGGSVAMTTSPTILPLQPLCASAKCNLSLTQKF